ncbi:MAG: hypothetical protein V1724_04800 [Chloroflexota bacterium]
MTDPIIVAELIRIAEANDGELRPCDVVEAARSESSPIHHIFNWNVEEAAYQHNLEQARRLIRVTVHYIGDDPAPVRIWVSLTKDRTQEGGGYKSVVAVMSDRDMRAQLLQDAFDEMKRFEAKYARFVELADVLAAMRKARQVIVEY